MLQRHEARYETREIGSEEEGWELREKSKEKASLIARVIFVPGPTAFDFAVGASCTSTVRS